MSKNKFSGYLLGGVILVCAFLVGMIYLDAIQGLGLATVINNDIGSLVDAQGVSDRAIPGQYIVVLKEDAGTMVYAQSVADTYKVSPSFTYTKAINGFAASLTQTNLSKVKSDPRVAYIAQDRTVKVSSHARKTVNVSTVSKQTLPTGVDRINAENKTNKGKDVNIAILDTGIDFNHPDLKATIAGGKNCSTGTTYNDGHGHGTHVAGTVAALDNTIGVVGVAPETKLWAVRVLNNNGTGSWSSLICGIDFVTSKAPKNGGKITLANMSLGGSGTSDNNCGKTNNDPLHQAICRSRDAGVTYVVSAGNEGVDVSRSVPAAYDDAVITVSALADSDGKSGGTGPKTSYAPDDTFPSFSNYGKTVDLAAPGVRINSTWKGGGLRALNGTSMSTAHVTGVAALYVKNNPGSTWKQVRDALISLGEKLNDGHKDPSGKHPEPVVRADTL